MKNGVQLSTNFIVILILCIATLVIGFFFLKDLFSGGSRMINEIGPSYEAELDRMLQKERIAVFPSSVKASRGKQCSFSAGILNTEEESQFTVSAEISAGYDGKTAVDYDFSRFGVSLMKNYIIEKDASEKFLILISVPKGAPAGTYVLNLNVCNGIDFPEKCEAPTYDVVEKMYIVVE